MMAATKVTFFPTMDWMLKSPEGDVGRMLSKRGRRITTAAKHQVGVDTGALRASISMRHGADARGQYIWVGSENRHALAHHEGTRPHIIIPKKAKMLRFTRSGAIVFAHAVKHPGTRANKYLSDNLVLAIL